MKSLNKLAIGIGALGLLSAAPAFASPVLSFTTTNYGSFALDVFGGFDWNSAASAVTTGFTGTPGEATTTTYWANAVAIASPFGVNFSTPGLTTNPGDPVGWEFTILATIHETVQGCVPVFGATTCAFDVTDGTFDIYFNATANANYSTGAGFTDGAKVFSGHINPGFAGTFSTVGGGGAGSFDFAGALDDVNAAFVDTAYLNTTAVSTLQIGNRTTNWTTPTNLPGAGGAPGALIPGEALIFQADGNQSFRIPEPGTMALLGLSLVGLGFTARRNKG